MEKITINGKSYFASPVAFPLGVDGTYKGSIVANGTAPLLYGALSVSYNYLGLAPTELRAKLYSAESEESESAVIRLHSDNVDTHREEELFFDSITIDDNFDKTKVSVYFNGYQLRKINKVKKLQLLPNVNDAVYVPSISVGGSCNWTPDECEDLRKLIHKPLTRTLTNNSNVFEKGLATNISFTHSVTPNKDVVTTALFDGVDISGNLNNTVVFNGVVDSVTKTLAITVQSGNNPANLNSDAIAYIPQYVGAVDGEEGEPTYSYVGLQGGEKIIQASNTISKTFVLVNEMAYFISRNPNANFVDPTNGFPYSVGEWNDVESFMIKKTVTTHLADGTQENLTLYRMREAKTNTVNIRLL